MIHERICHLKPQVKDVLFILKPQLESAAKLGFMIDSTDAAKFTVWRLNERTSKKGTTYSLKSLGSVKIAKGGTEQLTITGLEDGSLYYFSMESTAKKGGDADCTVKAIDFIKSDFLSDALAVAEAAPAMADDGNLAMANVLSFGQYGGDVLADASAASLSELDGKSAWQNLAMLA